MLPPAQWEKEAVRVKEVHKEPEGGRTSRLSPTKLQPESAFVVHPSTHRSRVPSLLFLETCKTGCLQVLGNELKPEESKLIYGLTKSRNGKCLLAHA